MEKISLTFSTYPRHVFVSNSGPIILSLTSEVYSIPEFSSISQLEKDFPNFKIVWPEPFNKNWMMFGRKNDYEINFLNDVIGLYKPVAIIGFGYGASVIPFLNLSKNTPAIRHSPIFYSEYNGPELLLGGKKNVLQKSMPSHTVWLDCGYSWGGEMTNQLIKNFLLENIP